MAALAASFKEELKIERYDCLNGDDVEMDVTEQLEDGEISDTENVLPPASSENVFLELQDGVELTNASKRFDLIGDKSLAVPQDELNTLYASLGIDQENERHYRFNTVHVRGTGKMKTKDVYDYFSGLDPSKVIWLDEGACNVEWDDEIMPARALLYLSIEIKNLEKRFKMESGLMDYDSDSELELVGDSVDACKLKFLIPPGRWRKGTSSDLSKEILMRYANKDDKKVVISSKRSERRHRHSHSSKSSKKSRRQEIQIEEPASKNPWGALAQSWGKGEGVEQLRLPASDPQLRPDLRASLNDIIESRLVDSYLLRALERRRAFPHSPMYSSSGEDSDSQSDNRRRKLPRMYADHEEERQKIKRLIPAKGDLRERLNRRKLLTMPSVKSPVDTLDVSEDELSSDWAVENYKDLRKSVNSTRERDDTEGSGSELEFGDDEPGELLQIEIDNDRYFTEKRRKH